MDPVTFELIRHKLLRVTDETIIALENVSGSPITNEGHDMMASLYLPDGGPDGRRRRLPPPPHQRRAGGVELGTEPAEARQDLVGRVGLHGVEDVRGRKQLPHAAVVVLHHVEIDHEAGGLGLLLSEITRNTLGHCWGVPRLTCRKIEKVSKLTAVPRDESRAGQRASANTRRRLFRGGPANDRAYDTDAGSTPRAASKHIRSSLSDPACAGTAKKDAFRRCVTTMGQRHVRGRLLSLSTTNVRRYKWILPRRQNF